MSHIILKVSGTVMKGSYCCNFAHSFLLHSESHQSSTPKARDATTTKVW